MHIGLWARGISQMPFLSILAAIEQFHIDPLVTLVPIWGDLLMLEDHN
jgi:hypothetical protein